MKTLTNNVTCKEISEPISKYCGDISNLKSYIINMSKYDYQSLADKRYELLQKRIKQNS